MYKQFTNLRDTLGKGENMAINRLPIFIFCICIVEIYCNNSNQTLDNALLNNKPCDNSVLKEKVENCTCLGGLGIRCVLNDNTGMNRTLSVIIKLNYTRMQELIFVLNDSLQGYLPITEMHALDLSLLGYFTDLLRLWIIPTQYQTQYVPLNFTMSTFDGCSKLEELHLNIPLNDTSMLEWMLRPLKNLKLLDFSNIRGVSYRNMNKAINGLNENIEQIYLRNFQAIGQWGYLSTLAPLTFLTGPFTELVKLDLSNNGFAVIEAGWHNVAPNLKYFDISHNGLTYGTNNAFLNDISIHPNLEIFNISYQGSYDSLNTFIYGHYVIGDDASVNTRHRESKWSYLTVETTDCLSKYTRQNISFLFGSDIKPFCDFLRYCLFPSLTYLACDNLPSLNNIFDPDCEMWVRIPIAPNIREVHFAHTFLDIFSHKGIVFYGTVCFSQNNLKKLDFSSNYFWANYAKLGDTFNEAEKIVGLENITELDLSANNLSLKIGNAFVNFPNLQLLNLSRNLVKMPDGLSLCSDINIHNLKQLDLSYNALGIDAQNAAKRLVENCKNLIKLHLVGNNLDSGLFLSFNGMDNLTFIDLSFNKIETISSAFQMELDKMKNLTINISNNRLTCACTQEDLRFVEWFHNPRRLTQIENDEDLLCAGRKGMVKLKSVAYITLRNDCFDVIIISTCLSASVAISLVVFVIYTLYRRRFRIQYRIFTFIQWIRRTFGSDGDGGGPGRAKYEYDAFVSYSSEDRFWVHDVLMKTLEETHGFKLVIHYRDFPLGMNIQHAIDDSMSKSREHILVMSTNYLESDWCLLEMEEAYRESLRRRTHLAIIILGNVPTRIENPTANRILDEHNYLQWKIKEKEAEKEDLSNRKLFWARLVKHLYGKDNSCCCCCSFAPRPGYMDVQDFAGNSENAPTDFVHNGHSNFVHENVTSDEFNSDSFIV